MKKIAIIAALMFLPCAAWATPPNINQTVGICDPNAPQNCVKPDSSGNIPVTGGGGSSAAPSYQVTTAANAAKTDISATIAAGGTAQLVMAVAATGAVRHILLQNLSTDPFGCSFTTTTPVIGAAGTFILKAAVTTTSGDGGSYSTPGLNDNQALYCIAATTGDKLFGNSQ